MQTLKAIITALLGVSRTCCDQGSHGAGDFLTGWAGLERRDKKDAAPDGLVSCARSQVHAHVLQEFDTKTRAPHHLKAPRSSLKAKYCASRGVDTLRQHLLAPNRRRLLVFVGKDRQREPVGSPFSHYRLTI
jgi:hypothetical protein